MVLPPKHPPFGWFHDASDNLCSNAWTIFNYLHADGRVGRRAS